MQEVTLTREEHRTIKNKNRTEMTKFLRNVYMEGWKDGLHNKAKVTPEDIYNIIKATKGVGETKRKAIMEKVTKLFEEEEQNVE